MGRWHHRLNRHGFVWTPGIGDEQGGLACCNSWVRRVGHDWVTHLNLPDEDLWDLLELTLKKDALFIIGDWHAKAQSQETPEVTGKFGLGVQNEAGQRLIRVLPREHTGHSKYPLPTTREDFIHGHHQMVNTKTRLVIIFAAKDGEALYSQQKQDRELNVCDSDHELLLPNSDSNCRK